MEKEKEIPRKNRLNIDHGIKTVRNAKSSEQDETSDDDDDDNEPMDFERAFGSHVSDIPKLEHIDLHENNGISEWF